MFCTRIEARVWLGKRYDAQVVKFPRLAARISRDDYIRRNLSAAMVMSVDDEQLAQLAR